MSCKSLMHSYNTSVQLQLFILSKVFNNLDPYQVRTEYSDLGPSCLKVLSAADNVMFKFNA